MIDSELPTLTKQRLVREVGRRTHLSNKDAGAALEAVITILSEQLAAGGRIELANFFTLDVQRRTRVASEHIFGYNSSSPAANHQTYFVLRCKPGKRLRAGLRALALKR